MNKRQLATAKICSFCPKKGGRRLRIDGNNLFESGNFLCCDGCYEYFSQIIDNQPEMSRGWVFNLYFKVWLEWLAAANNDISQPSAFRMWNLWIANSATLDTYRDAQIFAEAVIGCELPLPKLEQALVLKAESTQKDYEAWRRETLELNRTDINFWGYEAV